jgi:ribulose-phosphate 3-epimerase
MNVRIAPSILAADFSHLADEIARVSAAGADLIHVDIMDGHFVPNITFGPLVVAALKRTTSVPLDVHLMIDQPDRYLGAFIDAGAAMVTVHVEALAHLHRAVMRVKELGAKAGVAINPATPVSTLSEIVAELDHVLVMSVNPGFTGQSFIPNSLRKIAEVRDLIAARGGHAAIEVDGGVDASNAAQLVQAGASILVAGAAIFHTPDASSAVQGLRFAASAARP